MNEPKQTQLNIEKTGWTQLTLLDDAPGPRLIAIRSALRCPLCGAQLDHVIGGGGLCECPRCGMELDL
jgi:hypothetical protein